MPLVTRKTHGTCKIFDANGLQWTHIRWVNTDTGEASQCILDEYGNKKLDESMREIKAQIVMLPLPVLIVPIKEQPCH